MIVPMLVHNMLYEHIGVSNYPICSSLVSVMVRGETESSSFAVVTLTVVKGQENTVVRQAHTLLKTIEERLTHRNVIRVLAVLAQNPYVTLVEVNVDPTSIN